MHAAAIKETMQKTLNVSRRERTIFSSPFNAYKLGINCAATAFDAHCKRMSKMHPDQFAQHANTRFVCTDADCIKARHLQILEKYLKCYR
jgi:hypothetical protein